MVAIAFSIVTGSNGLSLNNKNLLVMAANNTQLL
jgi:hypothetical protein